MAVNKLRVRYHGRRGRENLQLRRFSRKKEGEPVGQRCKQAVNAMECTLLVIPSQWQRTPIGTGT